MDAHAPYFHLWPVRLSPNYLMKRYDLQGKIIEYTVSVLIFIKVTHQQMHSLLNLTKF